MGALGRRPGVACGGWRGGEWVSTPASQLRWFHTLSPPQVSREVRFGALRGPGVPGPQGQGGGRVPNVLGGGGACTGGPQGGPCLGGLGRRGVLGRAMRTALPPLRAGPVALGLGGPVRPEAAPPSTAGLPQSPHVPRARHGSSG